MADDPAKSPTGTQGQGDPSPDDPGKKGKQGQEGDPPAGAQGQDDKTDYKKSYDELRSVHDKLTGERGRVAKMAEKYGYDPETELERFIADLDYSYQQLSGGDKGGDKGGKPDDKGKPPDKQDDLSADIKRSLAISTKLSLDAKKDGQFEAFLRKNPDFDESLRPELDAEIDSLMDENPKVFQKGNWYDKAQMSKMVKQDDYITKIKQSAIKGEEERQKKLGDLGSETGGAKAGGQSKTLEDELKKRLA